VSIDARAIVDPGARLGDRVSIGPWTIVGPGVEIGDDCQIDAHVILRGPTRLGARNRVAPFASLGEGTPALAFDGEPTTLVIGDDNTIREGVTIHRGTVQDRGETRVGHHNLLMPYVHIGHDSVVGDHCIFANNASVSGHCRVGDHVGLGGYAGVPQYRAIGAHAFVGGMSLVTKDVPAFVKVAGHPARALGLNSEGLRRRGFDADEIGRLRDALRIVYRDGLRLAKAIERIEALDDPAGHLACLLASLREARWGIVRPRGADRDEPATDA
jgi:UDP-N-acetylglucosamine acyltransferase